MKSEDVEKIDAMGQVEMARILRFTPLGQWPFNDNATAEYFLGRFEMLGGMTSEVSKEIGWDDEHDQRAAD